MPQGADHDALARSQDRYLLAPACSDVGEVWTYSPGALGPSGEPSQPRGGLAAPHPRDLRHGDLLGDTVGPMCSVRPSWFVRSDGFEPACDGEDIQDTIVDPMRGFDSRCPSPYNDVLHGTAPGLSLSAPAHSVPCAYFVSGRAMVILLMTLLRVRGWKKSRG